MHSPLDLDSENFLSCRSLLQRACQSIFLSRNRLKKNKLKFCNQIGRFREMPRLRDSLVPNLGQHCGFSEERGGGGEEVAGLA
jgi:hypothetical protein